MVKINSLTFENNLNQSKNYKHFYIYFSFKAI